jgi:endoglucanase
LGYETKLNHRIALVLLTLLPATHGLADVFVNQVGFRPQDPKAFVTDEGAMPFKVIRLATGRGVIDGKTELRRTSDPATGLDVFWGGFSEVSEPGTYRVQLANGSESPPFDIREDVYADVAGKALKSYYLSRCGAPLEDRWAGKFARAACHTGDANYHPLLSSKGHRATAGGWHDAGDFGKYVHSASVSMAHMLMMYEQFPKAFTSDAVGIPESNNGIPDLLDEMQVELEWMLTMQVSDGDKELAGGVHYMVNTYDYVWQTATNDHASRFVYGISSVSTADFAAAMALAARVFASVPALKDDAGRYHQAALLAWDFLERHPGLYPENGFIRPADTLTGGYADSPDLNDRDDRLWAAVELALTGSNPRFIQALERSGHPFLKQNFFESESFSGELRWENTVAFPFVQAALHAVPGLESSQQKRIREQFLGYCQQLLKRIERDGFAVALDQYYWGSTGGALALGQMLVFASQLAPEPDRFLEGALYQLHYVLGRNALNTSFVSGVGQRYPRAIHHAVFANDGLEVIHPGLLAGGPNPNLGADETLPLYFDDSTPPAQCWVDHVDSWASNENCILYNAPLVALAFYLSGSKDRL